VHAFFTGSLADRDYFFSLMGLGLLGGFEKRSLNRDYPVVFATLYIFLTSGVVVNLISDPDVHLDRIRGSTLRRGRFEVDVRHRHQAARETTAVSPMGLAVLPEGKKAIALSPSQQAGDGKLPGQSTRLLAL